MTFKKLKLVSVAATHPFAVRGVFVRGIHRQHLDIDEIRDCIMQQTTVTEHLPNGNDVRLNLSNYDKDFFTKETKQVKVEPVKEEVKIEPITKEEEPVLEEKEELLEQPQPKKEFYKKNKK